MTVNDGLCWVGLIAFLGAIVTGEPGSILIAIILCLGLDGIGDAIKEKGKDE